MAISCDCSFWIEVFCSFVRQPLWSKKEGRDEINEMEQWQGNRLASWIPVCLEPSRPYKHVGGGLIVSSGTPSERRYRTEFTPKSYKRRQDSTAEYNHVENCLLQLCRAKNWLGVLHRCRSHPEEAVPRSSDEEALMTNRFDIHSSKRVVNVNLHYNYEQEPLHQETALGIACASKDIETEELKGVILALVIACPGQVRSSQLISGHTPLRDAILNPLCTPGVLTILMDGDLICNKKDDENAKSAFHQKDRNGLFPIDHLIMGVQLGSPSQCMSLLKEYFRSQQKTSSSSSDCMSPLIRLLTMGTSFGVKRNEIDFSPWRTSSTEDHPRLLRILEVTKYLLKEDPTLIHQCSRVTGCPPLHVALRNYGDYSPLIEELVSRDESNKTMKLRNLYGDLPLHVASSVGVPLDVLKLIVERTMAATGSENQNNNSLPNPLVWSANKSGYTPVDLEWVRHIESGKGFYTARSFYPLEPTGIRRHCFKQDEYYQDLLREAVDQVIENPRNEKDGNSAHDREEEAKNTFGMLIDRLSLLVSSACAMPIPSQTVPSLLHDVCKLCTPCGPSLPLPLLELFLWVHPGKLLEQDEHGNLPIHYALGRIKPLSKPSDANSCEDWKVFVLKLLQEAPESCRAANQNGRLPLHIILDRSNGCSHPLNDEIEQSRQDIVEKLVQIYPEGVDRRDPLTNLDPFMMAAKDPNLPVDSVFFLLHRSPSRCCEIGS
jgi:hypothetical protein